MAWRVVIATRILPVALGFDAAIREAGHEPVGLLTIRDLGGLYLDGSSLPAHRGPIPVSWAIRAGDEAVGVSFHFMDAELDTGPIVAQRRFPLGEPMEPDAFYAQIGPVVVETLLEALGRVAAGERGTPQEGGTYESFFTADDVWLDPTRTARELRLLAWAWLYTPPVGTERGLLAKLDGETVRVLETSLAEVEGAVRVDCAEGPLWLVRTERLPEPNPGAETPQT